MTAIRSEAATTRPVAAAPPRWGWLRTPAGALAGTTVLVGVTIAGAPVAGVVPVTGAALLWFVGVAWANVSVVVRHRGRWSAAQVVGAVGVALAALRLAALGLVQLLGDRPALFWNVDWRYHATQAHGIARFGTLDDSLDYAGTPVGYHAGPAWIGGSLQRTLGVPVDVVLFLVLPLVAVAVAAYGAQRLLRALGVGRDPALLTVGVAVGIATAPLSLVADVARGDLGALLDADAWWFTPSLMLNSLLALAIGLVASWLVVEARTWPRSVVGAVGLASLTAIKPQYLVGFVAALGLGFIVTGARARRWRELLLVVAVTAVGAALCGAVTPHDTTFTGVTVDLLHGVRAGVDDHELLLLALFATLVLVVLPAVRRTQPSTLVAYAACCVVGASSLFVFLYDVVFLLDARDVARGRAVGLAVTRTSYQYDFQQALLPAALVTVLLGGALAFGQLAGRSVRVQHATVIGAGLVIALTVPFAVAQVAAPTGRAGYEWAEEAGLRKIFRAVDVERGRWISSDLADPAEDFARPLRATNLTALGDAQFWVANVDYGGWTQSDAKTRVRALQRFFGTPWSPAHEHFLRAHDIRYVLVRDRCPPAWDADDFPGRVREIRDDWTLLELGGEGSRAASDRTWPEASSTPKFGKGDCLTGARSGSGGE